MFSNDLTRKMPCWDCVVDHDECKIIDGICILPKEVRDNICDLTFECLSKVVIDEVGE